MPKQLINTAGLLIVLAIIAAGTFLVALPIYLQSLGTDSQTRTVATQNEGTSTQAKALSDQKAQIGTIEGDAAELRAQIPDSPRLDTVSSLISAAATKSKVTVTSFAPSVPEDFTPGKGDGTAQGGATSPGDSAPADDATAAKSSKQQVPVDIEISAPDLKAVLTFLDELRAGPRLLGNLDVTYSSRSGGADARIKALAFTMTTTGAQQ